MDDAYPASSSSSRRRTTPTWPDGPCAGLGSVGVVLGGATYRGAQVGEEPACRWPEPSLVAVAWASNGPEARGLRGGGASPCQWGGRARPSLLVCVGAQVLQYLAGSPGISLELWSRDGSFSVGVHRPCRYPSCARVLVVLVMLYVWHYSGCISDNIRRCMDAWDDTFAYWMHANLNTYLFYNLVLLIECSNWRTTPILNAQIGPHYARRMHLISW